MNDDADLLADIGDWISTRLQRGDSPDDVAHALAVGLALIIRRKHGDDEARGGIVEIAIRDRDDAITFGGTR